MPSGDAVGAVVVTGASTGIGRACALHAARQGWLVFAGVRQDAAGEALRRDATGRLVPLRFDVADQQSIAAASATVRDALRQAGLAGLAGLVNNAGIAVAGPVEFVPLDALRRQLEVNVTGQVAVTQAFLPLLRAARGRLVMVGSISGRMAAPFISPYSASKFALEAIADALRVELRPWGMHVAIVEPGRVVTPIWDKSLAAADAMMVEAPAEVTTLYGPAIDAMRRATARMARRGLPPDRVARVIWHALTASRPKTRYVVGHDARLQAFAARWLPDRLRDALVVRALGLP